MCCSLCMPFTRVGLALSRSLSFEAVKSSKTHTHTLSVVVFSYIRSADVPFRFVRALLFVVVVVFCLCVFCHFWRRHAFLVLWRLVCFDIFVASISSRGHLLRYLSLLASVQFRCISLHHLFPHRIKKTRPNFFRLFFFIVNLFH